MWIQNRYRAIVIQEVPYISLILHHTPWSRRIPSPGLLMSLLLCLRETVFLSICLLSSSASPFPSSYSCLLASDQICGCWIILGTVETIQTSRDSFESWETGKSMHYNLTPLDELKICRANFFFLFVRRSSIHWNETIDLLKRWADLIFLVS